MPFSVAWYAGHTSAEHMPLWIESIFSILILDQELREGARSNLSLCPWPWHRVGAEEEVGRRWTASETTNTSSLLDALRTWTGHNMKTAGFYMTELFYKDAHLAHRVCQMPGRVLLGKQSFRGTACRHVTRSWGSHGKARDVLQNAQD